MDSAVIKCEFGDELSISTAEVETEEVKKHPAVLIELGEITPSENDSYLIILSPEEAEDMAFHLIEYAIKAKMRNSSNK